MQAALYASLLLLLVCGACAQTLVPLINDVSNSTAEVGAFQPNGTLAPGQSMTFYSDVKDVKNGYGISVYFASLVSTAGGLFSNASLYFKRGETPSALSYDDTASTSCPTTACTNLANYGVGKCNPKKGNYYYTITNTGISSVNFTLNVAVDMFGGSFISCGAISWFEHLLKEALGIFIAIIVLIIVAIITCLGLCCYFCCCRNRHHSYHQVSQHDHHHHVQH
eukprot:Phypoly_transcript_17344.p1 GENE.Phypoly_transcript_17344~~Phypoly_transcript_17344.p1  ORF type:complete len:223 (-),score=18.01 Phypoly_transcript_17344:52-720(-)